MLELGRRSGGGQDGPAPVYSAAAFVLLLIEILRHIYIYIYATPPQDPRFSGFHRLKAVLRAVFCGICEAFNTSHVFQACISISIWQSYCYLSSLSSQARLLSLSLSLPRSVPASPYVLQNEQCYYCCDTSTLTRLLLLLPGVVP